MIIAIDGPAASGKGTIARRLAAHYGLPHLDTGLLYRATAAALIAADRDLYDEPSAVAAARGLGLTDFDEIAPAHAARSGRRPRSSRRCPAFGPRSSTCSAISPPAAEARCSTAATSARLSARTRRQDLRHRERRRRAPNAARLNSPNAARRLTMPRSSPIFSEETPVIRGARRRLFAPQMTPWFWTRRALGSTPPSTKLCESSRPLG